MRALKERSGLTLRQLEDQATARGDALARSTAADLLRRQTLPRPELVAAFVRACGEQNRLADWMRAYERLVREATDTTADTVADPPPPTRPARTRLLILLTLVMVVAAVLLVITITTEPDRPPTPDPPDVLPLSSAGEWVRIRPARTPDLCLTEGFDRSLRYEDVVMVQLPCTKPDGPRTLLEPVDEDLTQIKWEHPKDKVMGCLTIREEPPAKDMLEPRSRCDPDDDAQLFRIERFAPDSLTGYRLRRAHTDQCVGLRKDDTAEGAEAVQQPCDSRESQRFLVDLKTTNP
ncbi:hypothetical protein BLA60_03435 [Actinophytocola xinjiangensis]|uniref:Ricin-type beta-trefoil lectin protein n=1 Tax=Actinophytocola xinjiangensis TaxID=485602 RepID=A0A7Z0WUS2_9PSEU|nr:hypothetical protein BLA60_03435 [Actinophytocola xinjiangensis]